MIQIDIDFDTIREKLFDLVDEAIDAASEAVDKFNDAFAGDRIAFDIESFGFDHFKDARNKAANSMFSSYYGG